MRFVRWFRGGASEPTFRCLRLYELSGGVRLVEFREHGVCVEIVGGDSRVVEVADGVALGQGILDQGLSYQEA